MVSAPPGGAGLRSNLGAYAPAPGPLVFFNGLLAPHGPATTRCRPTTKNTTRAATDRAAWALPGRDQHQHVASLQAIILLIMTDDTGFQHVWQRDPDAESRSHRQQCPCATPI